MLNMDRSKHEITTKGIRRFFSLRAKFVGFISLIIIVTCTDLSWYFIQQQIASMSHSLVSTGTLLVKNLAYNSRYGLITEDPLLLERLVAGALEAEEVAYVIITAADGKVLVARTKAVPALGERPIPPAAREPPPWLAQAVLESMPPDPVVTELRIKDGRATEARGFKSRDDTPTIPVFAVGSTLVYDFALGVRRSPPSAGASPLVLEAPELLPQKTEARIDAPKPYGVIQVGVSAEHARLALTRVIWNIVLITLIIIASGIGATILLARQVIGPIRQLAQVAQRVTEGDLTASVAPTTRDEVGQLTELFNQMTAALSSQIETITRQVTALSTLHQASTAITSTLDVDRLLDTVLQLLSENLGFSRMLLVLYDPTQGLAVPSRVAGVPEAIQRAATALQIPVRDDGGTDADLLLHGKPLLIADIEQVADRTAPAILALARQVGVRSYVAAPLRSKQRILGYVAADKHALPCTQEDLDLLVTIASHVAVALDNAGAYQQLGHLTQTLEQRVGERTRELQAANEKLQELDRLKSAFVSIVSHELRTPMTSIKGYVENMLEGLTGPLTGKQTHHLTRVKHNAERLTRMLNDLLDLSRIEAWRIQLVLAPVGIRGLIGEVVEGFRQAARGKSVTLRETYDGDIPATEADRDKLIQILTNLIQNAIKFTPKGGQITVETRVRDDGFLEFCIADTGCGIPAQELERVFEKFYRGEATPMEARGAGLGLAITKSLVQLHGGRIWVESTVGAGSRFSFTIPLRPAQS